jgi:hypothetical protein
MRQLVGSDSADVSGSDLSISDIISSIQSKIADERQHSSELSDRASGLGKALSQSTVC